MSDRAKPELKKERLEIRLQPDDKRLLEQAAHYRGVSISSYALSVLREVAVADLERAKETVMSDRDRDLFLELLDAPSLPNQYLVTAVERYNAQPKAPSRPAIRS